MNSEINENGSMTIWTKNVRFKKKAIDLAVQGAGKQVVLDVTSFSLFQSKRYRSHKHQSVIWDK